MKYTIRHRRGTTAQWNAANPVLAFAEVGVENTGTGLRSKIGDGSTAWAILPYADDTALAAALAAEANAVSHADAGDAAALTASRAYTDGKTAGLDDLLAGTGWRNITHPSITAGKVQICRVGTRVYMNWDGAVFGNQTGHVYLAGVVPEGFRTTMWIPFSTVALYGPALGCRLIDATSTGGPGTIHIAGLTSGAILRTYVMWETKQPWPAVLPGTPA